MQKRSPLNKDKARIAIVSRYQLSEQYKLAAEFKPMLLQLGERNQLLHMSFRNTGLAPEQLPESIELVDIPLSVNRRSARDIAVKSLLMYMYLPLAALRLRRFKPDVIFISETLPLCGLLLKLFCGRRVVMNYGDWHVHNYLGNKRWLRPLVRTAEALQRFEISCLDGIFCRAESVKADLIKAGIRDKDTRVVNDAPDLTAFFPQDQRELRIRSGFSDEDVILLYHGVMHHEKGLDLLLEWTAALCKEDSRIGIFMVGAGPELQSLKELAVNCGLGSRVVFTGWLETVQDVGRYCNAADICVAMRTGSESNAHIIPGALLHSMACRKTVVAPSLPGILEIIRHGENGFVFRPDDAESFKTLIRKLASDSELRAEVAANAYHEILQNFSVEKIANKYAAALEHFAGVPARPE